VSETAPLKVPHPVVWTILYLPFGALQGFVQVALTFLATKHGLSITEGALLNGASLLTSWLKWLWAPLVDVTLTPKRWHVIATAASALGVFGMAIVPLGPNTLGLLLAIIAGASLINSIVGMSCEAIIAACTPKDQAGRVSAWFQAGNLGGVGLGGALGLFLVVHLPQPWMAGAIMAVLFMLCCLALVATPKVQSPHAGVGAAKAVRGVIQDLRAMLKTRGGLLSAILCVLPVGTGAAQVVLTQEAVAKFWGAGEHEVELLQGLFAGFVTMAGCFGGGWLCNRFPPRATYAAIGLVFAVITIGMAASPATISMYIAWSLVYSLAVGFAYAAFTAVVLEAMGHGSGATKYNVFASLSNFPIWWLGLLLGYAGDRFGPRAMLLTESLFGVLGVTIFVVATRRVRVPALAASA
jgi:MFS family permease